MPGRIPTDTEIALSDDERQPWRITSAAAPVGLA